MPDRKAREETLRLNAETQARAEAAREAVRETRRLLDLTRRLLATCRPPHSIAEMFLPERGSGTGQD